MVCKSLEEAEIRSLTRLCQVPSSYALGIVHLDIGHYYRHLCAYLWTTTKKWTLVDMRVMRGHRWT
jgi:hypothetical protein